MNVNFWTGMATMTVIAIMTGVFALESNVLRCAQLSDPTATLCVIGATDHFPFDQQLTGWWIQRPSL